MNYATEPPFVTVFSCDYTYQLYLYSKQLRDSQKTISFPGSLLTLREYTKPVVLSEFVQLYLSGKVGTPLLMLPEIFATPGHKLVIGLPPELLQTPSPIGQPLAAILNGQIAALGTELQHLEKAEAEAEAEAHRNFQQQQQRALMEKRYLKH